MLLVRMFRTRRLGLQDTMRDLGRMLVLHCLGSLLVFASFPETSDAQPGVGPLGYSASSPGAGPPGYSGGSPGAGPPNSSSSAKKWRWCYVCTGNVPEKECETAPDVVIRGRLNCTKSYCGVMARYTPRAHLMTLTDDGRSVPTKELAPQDYEVTSIARNCEYQNRGNLCVKDGDGVGLTCYSTCTDDHCNRDTPPPAWEQRPGRLRPQGRSPPADSSRSPSNSDTKPSINIIDPEARNRGFPDRSDGPGFHPFPMQRGFGAAYGRPGFGAPIGLPGFRRGGGGAGGLGFSPFGPPVHQERGGGDDANSIEPYDAREPPPFREYRPLDRDAKDDPAARYPSHIGLRGKVETSDVKRTNKDARVLPNMDNMPGRQKHPTARMDADNYPPQKDDVTKDPNPDLTTIAKVNGGKASKAGGATKRPNKIRKGKAGQASQAKGENSSQNAVARGAASVATMMLTSSIAFLLY